MRKKILCCALIALLASAGNAAAGNQINIVGSSTVYPFATVVAERFGRITDFKTPKIESTGSGGGLKLFCDSGVNAPDITNSSRRIKQKEINKCRANGVAEIIEVKAGYDGIVLANSQKAPLAKISLETLYLALAKDVPNLDGSESFVPNPYHEWSDIDPALPGRKIEVLGPPPTSGTRDAFVELALEGGCKKFDWVAALKKKDKSEYKTRCHAMREDGAYVEAGENDNLIVHKLTVNPDAFGVFGFSFLEQNRDLVQGTVIDGVEPTFEAITDGSYPVSRALYFYVNKAHIGTVPGILEYMTEFISDAASGEEGYLTDKGMIPLPAAERVEVKSTITTLKVMPSRI